MGRKKRPAQQHRATARQPTAQAVATAVKSVSVPGLTADSFSNVPGRLGFGTPNLMESAEYPVTRLTQNYGLLNSMFRNDWIAAAIVTAIPTDMCKNWYTLKGQITPEQIAEYETVERKTKIKRQILRGLKWGSLFGGAAGIIVVQGQEDMLDQPLNLHMIMPGQFRGIIIADRWSGVYPDTTLVQDIDDPDFGTPEFYNFAMSETDIANGIKVHHSRVLIFPGEELPYNEAMAENWWGMSKLERVYTELTKRNTTSANIAQLIFQANIRTYKMANLGELLMATDPQSQRDLYQVLSAQNHLMSSMGMNVMDKEDEFSTSQYTFSGVSDVYELFMLDVAGAAETPVTKLFGRSPAGMNATGESDLTNYYDKVSGLQEEKLRPLLEKLMPVISMSTWGAIPDDLAFEFNPVRDTSEQERANLIQQSTAAVTSVFSAGIISQRTALLELRQTGIPLGMWSNITDEDIAAADDGTMPDQGEGDYPDPAEGDTDQDPFDHPSTDTLAFVSGTADFAGQKREKNGRFGTGKKGGGSSASSGGGGRKIPPSQFSSMVRKGEVNTHLIKKGGINKHDRKSLEYHAYAQERKALGKTNPAYFTVDNPESLRDHILSDEGIAKSTFSIRHDGIIRQVIVLDKPVGVSYNRDNKPVETNKLAVEYSAKNGMHYYPIHEGD